jgi:hypothetical protein
MLIAWVAGSTPGRFHSLNYTVLVYYNQAKQQINAYSPIQTKMNNPISEMRPAKPGLACVK